ncbi:MAG: glycosylase, partial [Candidatus Thorarchaeota archaeon]
MSKARIIGNNLPNIPWENRPEGSEDLVWRYSKNPIVGWNPVKGVARIFNSAVAPYQGKFVGIFRADHTNSKPDLHVGWSDDGIEWRFESARIKWVDQEGEPYPVSYAYDPRMVELDGRYYVVWCTGFVQSPALGIGYTEGFETFIRLDNTTVPFNRNGVLFPRKIHGNYVMLNRPSDNGHTPFGDIYLSESPDMIYWGKH